LLQTRSPRNDRILHFLELPDVERAVGEPVIDPLNLRLDLGKVGFEPVNLRLLRL
jgi:hypothetical protein